MKGLKQTYIDWYNVKKKLRIKMEFDGKIILVKNN